MSVTTTPHDILVTRDSDIDTTTLTLKSGAGVFYGFDVHNPSVAVVYVHLYDDTTLKASFPVLATNRRHLYLEGGIKCSTSVAVTGSTAFAGTGDPASAVVGTFFWK